MEKSLTLLTMHGVLILFFLEKQVVLAAEVEHAIFDGLHALTFDETVALGSDSLTECLVDFFAQLLQLFINFYEIGAFDGPDVTIMLLQLVLQRHIELRVLLVETILQSCNIDFIAMYVRKTENFRELNLFLRQLVQPHQVLAYLMLVCFHLGVIIIGTFAQHKQSLFSDTAIVPQPKQCHSQLWIQAVG